MAKSFKRSRPKGSKLYQKAVTDPIRAQETRAYHRLLMAGTIVVLLTLFLYFYGISLIAAIGAFWQQFNLGPNTNYQSNLAPTPFLGPPRLDSLPEALKNSQDLIVGGWTAAGYEVTILVDGKAVATLLADASGRFEAKNLKIEEGQHRISSKVKNASGVESAESPPQTVILDSTPPKLTVFKPTPEERFTDQEDAWITVEGTAEPQASVYVNDWQAQVDLKGNFQQRIKLNNGENILKVKVADRAGNISKQEIKVYFEAS